MLCNVLSRSLSREHSLQFYHEAKAMVMCYKIKILVHGLIESTLLVADTTHIKSTTTNFLVEKCSKIG